MLLVSTSIPFSFFGGVLIAHDASANYCIAIAVNHDRRLGVAPGHTDKTACETTANASERPPTYYWSMQAANHWLALASDGWRVERAMGIENTAGAPPAFSNHGVTSPHEHCVRFLCEKRCHTSQRQPTRALLMC
jgi:hypothetical protein